MADISLTATVRDPQTAVQATAVLRVSSSGVVRIPVIGSNGWTKGAEAIAQAVIGENTPTTIHAGDLDFANADLTQACTNLPGLDYYCAGTSPNSQQSIRTGYIGMMSSLIAKQFLVAWGNHEYDGDDPRNGLQNYYRTTFGGDFGGQHWYALDIATGSGPARFIFIDTTNGSNVLAVGSPQRVWLENELIAAQNHAWRIVVGHVQPYTLFKPFPSWWPVKLFSDLKVDLYVGGHPLAYERSKQLVYNPADTIYFATAVDSDDSLVQGAGVVYMTVGGSGMHPYGTLGSVNPISARFWTRKTIKGFTYAVLEWSADGKTLTINCKGYPGQPDSYLSTGNFSVFDTFTISK